MLNFHVENETQFFTWFIIVTSENVENNAASELYQIGGYSQNCK